VLCQFPVAQLMMKGGQPVVGHSLVQSVTWSADGVGKRTRPIGQTGQG
jgi:hypothetical protein